MTTTPSIRTAWPGPRLHRHRRAVVPRIRGVRRVAVWVVALLAGLFAMNGVIQAVGSPSPLAGSGDDVDIASLLPPAVAEAPVGMGAAGTVQVVEEAGAGPAPVARRSDSAAVVVPQTRARSVPLVTARPGVAVVAGSPEVVTSPTEQAARAEGERSGPPRGGDDRAQRADSTQRAHSSRPKITTTPGTVPRGIGAPKVTGTPKPARDQGSRPGRGRLLLGVGCLVDRVPVRVDDRPLRGTGCR